MASNNIAATADELNLAFEVNPNQLRTTSSITALADMFEDKALDIKSEYLEVDNVAGAAAIDDSMMKMSVLANQWVPYTHIDCAHDNHVMHDPARRRAVVKDHKQSEKAKQNTSGVERDLKMLKKNQTQMYKIAGEFVDNHMQVWG